MPSPPTWDPNQLIYSTPHHRFKRLGCTTVHLNNAANDWFSVSQCKVNMSFVAKRRIDVSVTIQGIFQLNEVLLVRYVLLNQYGYDVQNAEFTNVLPSAVSVPAAQANLVDGEAIIVEHSHTVTQADIDEESLTFEAGGTAEWTDLENNLITLTAPIQSETISLNP